MDEEILSIYPNRHLPNFYLEKDAFDSLPKVNVSDYIRNSEKKSDNDIVIDYYGRSIT